MKDLVNISKNSWLGNIPLDWEILRVKNLFEISKEKNDGEELPVLSLTQKGIKIRDISDNEGQIAATYENYTRIRKDDIVFNPMDLCTGAVDLSIFDGVISLAYTTIREKKKNESFLKYYKYFFQWHYLHKIFFPFGQGVSVDHRWTLKDDILMNFPVLVPPLETQKNIADFLDEKIKVIDEMVAKKEKMIELLREKRAALITHAVTKGLDSEAKMKPSGIDWLDGVPTEWKKLPLKFLFSYQSGGVWGDEARNDANDLICVRVADFDFVEFIAQSSDFTYRNLPDIKKWLLLDENSILLEKSGGGDQQPVGRTVRYLGKEKATCSNFIQKLQVDKKYNSEFIILLLSTLYFNGVTLKVIKKTTGIQNLDLPAFLRTDIFLPSKNEQKQIVDFVNVKSANIIDSTKKMNQQVDKLKEYRSSLIYSAVTGKIKI